MDINKGAEAVGEQGLSLRNIKIINDRIYEDRGFGFKDYKTIEAKSNKFFSKSLRQGAEHFAISENSGFIEFSARVPASNIRGSYTDVTRILDNNGKTIAWFKDTYGAGGEFIHRRYELPGPARYVMPDGSSRLKGE